jgi:hypothetical protein
VYQGSIDDTTFSQGDFMTLLQTETTPHQPRLHERVPTPPQSAFASIVIDGKLPAIDCDVIDFSAGGACLDVPGKPILPPRFELIHGDTRKPCRMVWGRGTRVGVVF